MKKKSENEPQVTSSSNPFSLFAPSLLNEIGSAVKSQSEDLEFSSKFSKKLSEIKEEIKNIETRIENLTEQKNQLLVPQSQGSKKASGMCLSSFNIDLSKGLLHDFEQSVNNDVRDLDRLDKEIYVLGKERTQLLEEKKNIEEKINKLDFNQDEDIYASLLSNLKN